MSQPALALTQADFDAIERELCSRSLADFVKRAWPVFEPGTPYIHGRHVDVICEHLEAVTRGEITRLLINVPPGTMKALDEDTPVYTLDGWKRHGDLVPGDYVYGSDGLPKRVLAHTPDVLEESYELVFDNGERLVAGAGHEWVVERDRCDATSGWERTRDSVVISTENLIVGHRPDRIRVTQPVHQPRRDLLIDPYILGAWLGDGSSSAGCIYAAEQDIDQFKKLGRIAHTTQPSGSRKQAFHRIVVDGLQVRLRVLGLLNNKHVPDNYITAPMEDRLALLQGMMDTDGTVEKHGACTFTNGNKRLIDAVQQIVSSLGCKPYVTSRYTTLNGIQYGPHYKVTFSVPEGIRPFRLPRKLAKIRYSDHVRTFCHYIKERNPVGHRVVKCIQVEGGVYLAGRFMTPTHNSTLVNIMWPAWEWGPKLLHHHRILSASYTADIATRDTRRMRQLITSDWYQTLWPHVVLSSDRNQVSQFENTARGWRKSSSVSSIMGERGHRVIWDDPNNTKDPFSVAKLEEAALVYREVLPTRMTDPKTSAIVIVQQRIGEKDISGLIAALGEPYTEVRLPMEFEPDTACASDWRTTAGELLFPERFPRDVVERDKKTMGSYAVASQFQQRPAPRGGGMFQPSWFEVVNAAPAGDQIRKRVVWWDFAATKATGSNDPDWTVGCVMSVTHDGVYYIEDVVRMREEGLAVERAVKALASQLGPEVPIRIPQDPGAAGKAYGAYLIRQLAGYDIKAVAETGSKEVRAKPVEAQAEAGNVKLVRGPWNRAFLDELGVFPAGAHDDQVDAMSGAFSQLVQAKQVWFV